MDYLPEIIIFALSTLLTFVLTCIACFLRCWHEHRPKDWWKEVKMIVRDVAHFLGIRKNN